MESLNRKVLYQIFEWDAVSWSKAVPFWEKGNIDIADKSVLTIGEKNGGLSLYFALRGARVTATDLDGVTPKAIELHQSYNVSPNIRYDKADILSLPYPDNTFDFVSFKSVLGALRTKENQLHAMKEIHRVLKPGGKLLFAENLVATKFHQWLRKKFIPWGEYWRYLSLSEMKELGKSFNKIHFTSYGVIATLGRTETQRRLLAYPDIVLSRLLPPGFRYIVFGNYEK